jgi:hypothetical protein
MRWAGHGVNMEEVRNSYMIPGKDINWEDNIKIDLKETGYDDMYFFQKL